MDTHTGLFPECEPNHFGLCDVCVQDRWFVILVRLCGPRLDLVHLQAVLKQLVHLDQSLGALGKCNILRRQRLTGVVLLQ